MCRLVAQLRQALPDMRLLLTTVTGRWHRARCAYMMPSRWSVGDSPGAVRRISDAVLRAHRVAGRAPRVKPLSLVHRCNHGDQLCLVDARASEAMRRPGTDQLAAL